MSDNDNGLEFDQYERKPFVVDAVEITESNIAKIAELIGQNKKTTEDENGTHILVDRRLIPNAPRVRPGFWLTRIANNYRVFSARVFAQQFDKSV